MGRSKHSGGTWYDNPSKKSETKPHPRMEKQTKEAQKRRMDAINAKECKALGMTYDPATGKCK